MSFISMRAQRMAAGTLSMVARAASRVLSVLPMGDRAERFLLERTWSSGSAAMLDRYLVAGYQNPRLNLQSIALRHVLLSRLFGAEFESIMDAEIRFAIGLNESLRARAAELGVTMGSYRNPIKQAAVRRVDAAIADRQMQLVDRWRSTLEGRSIEPLAVLELACGSANDYRAFAESGLARHLDYIGVDLSPKNVANARRRFPGASFEVGNILELPYPDGAFDEVIASDIFEHLSSEAMEAALEEAMRLARHGLILTFFNMAGCCVIGMDMLTRITGMPGRSWPDVRRQPTCPKHGRRVSVQADRSSRVARSAERLVSHSPTPRRPSRSMSSSRRRCRASIGVR